MRVKDIQLFLIKQNKKIFKNNKIKRKNNFGIWLQKTLLSQSEWKCKFNQKLIYNLQNKKTYQETLAKINYIKGLLSKIKNDIKNNILNINGKNTSNNWQQYNNYTNNIANKIQTLFRILKANKEKKD